MNYKLTFVKISNEHQFAGVGFAGNIFITLNALMHTTLNDKLYVDMETNECVCTEKNSLMFETKNCWEYYFEQNNINSNEPTINIDSLISARIQYEDRNMFMYPNNFIELKEKFYNSFKLKTYLKELLDDYYEKNIKNKVTLGVQVRLTDMKHYHNVSPVEAYIEKINQILIEHPEIEQIFLATDDSLAIKKIQDSIKIPIIYYEDMFRANEQNPHLHPYDRFMDARENHKYKLGVECIQEIFTLAKCDYLLKADVSSVSIIASILSENIKLVYKL
jgi:hypothetical protein